MEKKYLYNTVRKGISHKDVTLLLTKCFGEEHMSHKHNCYECQVKTKCRYVFNKDIKGKLTEKHKKQIAEKLKEKEEAPVKSRQKEVFLEKKELLKQILLSEKILKKQLKKKGKFKISKEDIKKELKEIEKTKRILKNFFR